MINLRYHIVSIVAVFLALGVGVALGATFIDRATVDFLNNRLDAVEDEVAETNTRNEELDGQLRELRSSLQLFGEQSIERLYDDRLTDVPVLILATRGVDEDAVAALQWALVESGSSLGGTVWFNEKISLTEPADVEAMAQILGLPGAVDQVVRNLLISRLAATLDAPVPPPAEGEPPEVAPEGETATTTPTDDDQIQVPLLVDLRSGGFIEFEPPASGDIDLTTVPLPGSRYVMIAGEGSEADQSLLVDVLRRVVRTGAAAPTVAVEVPTDDTEGDAPRVFVAPVRDDEDLTAVVSTVDNLAPRGMFGVAAVVYALVDIGEGRVGHYGVGAGAQRLVPAAPS